MQEKLSRRRLSQWLSRLSLNGANRALMALQDAAAFARDGFLIMRGCFSAEQIAAVSTVARADPVVDAARRESAKQIQLWGLLSEDDAYSALARQRCIVAPIEQMLGPVEHYHHKLIMKERESYEDGTSTGTWEWHQAGSPSRAVLSI